MAELWGAQGITLASTTYTVSSAPSLQEGSTVVKQKGDGTGGTRIITMLGGMPTITFSSSEIEALLDVTGLTALSIATLSGGIKIVFAKLDKVGRASGSVHRTLTMTAGVIVPTSISASEDGIANIQYTIHPISSGSSYPMTESATGALSTIASPSRLFTLGPAIINGTRRDGLSSWNLNLGQGLSKYKGDGSPYPKCVSVDEGEPTISLSTRDSGTLAGVIAAGVLAQGGTQSDFFLRAADNNGTVVAEASAEHIRLRMTAGLFTRDTEGGDTEIAMSATAHISKTGTTAMVGYTKDTAIPS